MKTYYFRKHIYILKGQFNLWDEYLICTSFHLKKLEIRMCIDFSCFHVIFSYFEEKKISRYHSLFSEIRAKIILILPTLSQLLIESEFN